jgi:hypothetical protein
MLAGAAAAAPIVFKAAPADASTLIPVKIDNGYVHVILSADGPIAAGDLVETSGNGYVRKATSKTRAFGTALASTHSGLRT